MVRPPPAAGEAGGETAGEAAGETETSGPAGCSSAETAQQIIDEVVEVAVAPEVDIDAGGTASATTDLIPVLAELLVTAALLRVGEHLVGLADLLEAGLRRRVPRIHIGMVLTGQFAEGALDAVGVGAALDTQHLEVIAVPIHAHLGTLISPGRPSPFVRDILPVQPLRSQTPAGRKPVRTDGAP